MKSRLFKKLLKINDLNKSIPFEKGFSREEGIRTPETFPFTRFPSVRLKPLGHLSKWRAKVGIFFDKECTYSHAMPTPKSVNLRHDLNRYPQPFVRY